MVLKDREHNGPRGIWIYGASGVGKSRCARFTFPDSYPKNCDKWWDGYNNHPYVIMDDLDPNMAKCLLYYIKIWSDDYPFTMHNKGGQLTDSYSKFIITSQYTIRECFPNDKDFVAIERRFKVLHIVY